MAAVPAPAAAAAGPQGACVGHRGREASECKHPDSPRPPPASLLAQPFSQWVCACCCGASWGREPASYRCSRRRGTVPPAARHGSPRKQASRLDAPRAVRCILVRPLLSEDRLCCSHGCRRERVSCAGLWEGGVMGGRVVGARRLSSSQLAFLQYSVQKSTEGTRRDEAAAEEYSSGVQRKQETESTPSK